MAVLDRIMYELQYRVARPRWDDGQVPPQVARLVSGNPNKGRALDLGCGTGTHSVYLALQGYSVTGVDISQTAINQARQKASQAGVKATFVVQDVNRLDSLPGPFDVALDVGCLHALQAGDQERYGLGLARLLEPGGTLLIWGMKPQSMGIGLTSEKVRQILGPAFQLEQVEDSHLHQRPSAWYWLRRR